MSNKIRFFTLLLIISIFLSLLQPMPVSADLISEGCPATGFTVTWDGSGTDVVDVCLLSVDPPASDGTVKLEFTITNRKSVVYNLSFEPTENVTAVLPNGQDVFEILSNSADKFSTHTALFPLMGKSTMHFAANFPPGGQLAINLSKFGDGGEHTVSLVALGLGSVFAQIFGGVDVGQAVSQDPNAGINFAATLLTTLQNEFFDLAGFTLKLMTGDVIGALEALAKVVEDAPEVWVQFIGLSEQVIKDAAHTIGNILQLIEAIPFTFDLLFAPSSGGFVVSRPNPRLDLIFAIDTTGSMWDDIAAVKASAAEIINSIDSRVDDYRIALVTYKDYPVSPYGGWSDYPARTDLAFTTDKSAVISAINSLSASGGADWQESVYKALMHAILDPSVGGWRDGASKQIILMGDAPPHDPEPFSGYVEQDVIDAAYSVDPAVIQAIVIGGDSSTYASFSSLAGNTNGQVFTAASSAEVVQAVMDAIGAAIEPPPPTDTTPPTIMIVPGVAPNYTQGTPLSFVATDDGGSGLQSSSAMLDGTSVETPVVLSIPGNHTFEVTAVDNAGNITTETISFNVYQFKWRPPVSVGNPHLLEYDSTLPVKFAVLDARNKLVVDKSIQVTLYDDTGSQLLGPFIYNYNNPNFYVDTQHIQYIHTLHTEGMDLELGLYEIRVTFNSPSLIGRNSIFIQIVEVKD